MHARLLTRALRSLPLRPFTTTPTLRRPHRLPLFLTLLATTTLTTVYLTTPKDDPLYCEDATTLSFHRSVAVDVDGKMETLPVFEFAREGKEKLVVLGTGWGATSVLKELEKTYEVLVVSPTNCEWVELVGMGFAVY
ncbi:hypothetical protein BC829DRAFT_276710 [Chytridium lagenaria]|nr:hypothetical protein BC829DRAFT_276710 [Chytridium lagenaria]